jgi:hypothetical protein
LERAKKSGERSWRCGYFLGRIHEEDKSKSSPARSPRYSVQESNVLGTFFISITKEYFEGKHFVMYLTQVRNSTENYWPVKAGERNPVKIPPYHNAYH